MRRSKAVSQRRPEERLGRLPGAARISLAHASDVDAIAILHGCGMSLPKCARVDEASLPLGVRLEPEQRFDFLLEASEMLGSSLDYETTLSDLARFLVPRFAAFCAIEIADSG